MKYRLFGMKPTAENISQAAGYFRAAPGYQLVYTRGRKPPGSIPVRAEQLSPKDRAWLQTCNMGIIQSAVNQDPGMQENMMQFLARLEGELEKEKAKLEVKRIGG